MQNLYTLASSRNDSHEVLNESEKFSIFYHDIFDYPLTFADLIKWNPAPPFPIRKHDSSVVHQGDYLFLQGRAGLIFKRLLRERISAKKMEIAKKASEVLSLVPSVKMVSVTGSLAMADAADESDIDLFVITSANLLWITRLLVYFILKVYKFDLRKAGDKNQKDKLCLNMWMDESCLSWTSPRNIYTAHEIAQIIPLINKSKTYEMFIGKNNWISNFWPNAVRIVKQESRSRNDVYKKYLFALVEKTAYWIQYRHMKKRMSREIVSPSRAIFHPQDWGEIVLRRLSP